MFRHCWDNIEVVGVERRSWKDDIVGSFKSHQERGGGGGSC